MVAMNLFVRLMGSGFRCLLPFWIGSFSSLVFALDLSTNRGTPCASVESCLQRAIGAPERLNFEGTFVVGGENQGATSHIVHYGDGRTQLERVERMDGPERVMYRRGDEVLTLWPNERAQQFEPRRLGKRFPVLTQLSGVQIADHYGLIWKGTSRVAGRVVDVMGLVPKDAYRYGYRLWLDALTGLPLRAEIVGAQQQVLEWAAFSDITIGIRAEPQRVLRGMRSHEGWAVKQALLVETTLVDEGWALGGVPAGFQLLRVVKRAAASEGASPVADQAQTDRAMLQLVFSDGLTYVSLFVEPFDAQAQKRNMLVSMGATQTLMVQRDAWWLTAMGDVPPISLKAFIASLQRRN